MLPVILVFAKAPVPGRVKTRLAPLLSPTQAAELHSSFVEDVLTRLSGFAHLAHVELHTDVLTEAWRDFPFQRALQSEGDLGDRMLAAIEKAFSAGHPQVLIVGTDSPNLPTEYLQEILSSEADVTLGPTEDGGYYAISLRRAHRHMFDGVAWSTEQTLAQTVHASERMGLSVALGRPWFDVDGPADLQRLASQSVPPKTEAWLKKHGFLGTSAHP